MKFIFLKEFRRTCVDCDHWVRHVDCNNFTYSAMENGDRLVNCDNLECFAYLDKSKFMVNNEIVAELYRIKDEKLERINDMEFLMIYLNR